MKSNETDCILELRSTITLMEQSLRQLCARVEALEDCENYRQQDEDIERAIEPKLNSSLVERVGNGENPMGSITAFYTLLLEGDDIHDPVADAARGALDGHIFLSRELADAGHYPAIDVEKSISRVMPKVASQEHLLAARKVKQWVSKYVANRDMVSMGAYMPGSDPDLAVINLVRNDFVPELSQELTDWLDAGKLIINCRAEGSPDTLNAALNAALTEVGKQHPQLFLRLEHLEHFRPGKPQPTHRDA